MPTEPQTENGCQESSWVDQKYMYLKTQLVFLIQNIRLVSCVSESPFLFAWTTERLGVIVIATCSSVRTCNDHPMCIMACKCTWMYSKFVWLVGVCVGLMGGVYPFSPSLPSGASGRRLWPTLPGCIGRPCPGMVCMYVQFHVVFHLPPSLLPSLLPGPLLPLLPLSFPPSSFSSGVPLRTADAKLVSWIPNKILYSYYQETNEDKWEFT